jgi:hypothetical protein
MEGRDGKATGQARSAFIHWSAARLGRSFARGTGAPGFRDFPGLPVSNENRKGCHRTLSEHLSNDSGFAGIDQMRRQVHCASWSEESILEEA